MNEHNDIDAGLMCNHDLAMEQLAGIRRSSDIWKGRTKEIAKKFADAFKQDFPSIDDEYYDKEFVIANCVGFIKAQDGSAYPLNFHSIMTLQFVREWTEAYKEVLAQDIAKVINGIGQPRFGASSGTVSIALAIQFKVGHDAYDSLASGMGWNAYLVVEGADKTTTVKGEEL